MKIDNETESALTDILDTVRDKVIEQNGQVLDWYVHDDTDAEQIVIGFHFIYIFYFSIYWQFFSSHLLGNFTILFCLFVFSIF